GVRSAIHYVILVVVLFTPVFIVDVLLTATYVIPEFKMVAAGMNFRLGALAIWVFGNTSWLVVFQIAMFSLLMLVVMIYVGGPDFARRFQFRGFPIADGIAWRIPWKRKRLQRTVSAMLAVLLDGGVPEAVAVRLAGDCTANQICRGRAQRVVAALQQGVKLDDAMRAFDHSGEFHWRLANTARARGGFLQGLRGWHESLDAKAFQQEEAAAHIVTTGVVILNGLLVALIAIAMFGIITTLLDNAVSNL
ncbi:MAG TPA: type II secretion system F family protein, partial [Verrucomicrobiae bacterium]|nr:type II secretion system F family protein [Verrucomicrobiae bacterium]